MKSLRISDILAVCDGEFYGDTSVLDKQITSITTDNRKATPNSLFASIVGQRVDAHDFIPSAFQSGAICAICEHKINGDYPYILVNSTTIALGKIAKYYRSLFDIPFIGITGSVGKTSTKEMLYSVLSQKYNIHKTNGNFNNQLGVPLTLFGLEEYHQIAIIEMGISDFGEMDYLSGIVRPDICVISNIGNCHLENLGDRDGVLKAKTEMLNNMSPNGFVVLNGDDDKLATVKSVNGKSPIFFGINQNNQYYAQNICGGGLNGISCTICTPNCKFDVNIPSIGNYMVLNTLSAVAVAQILGLSNSEIITGIQSYKTISGRSNLIKTDKYTIIDDCYNANPVSMKAGIDALCTFNGRKVCILGDMKELGANETGLHQEVGAYINTKNIDLLVTVGNLALNINSMAGTDNKVHFDTLTNAIDNLSGLLLPNDVILVKASNSMNFKQIVEFLKA